MRQFYINLKEGMEKDEALHLAKLSYLEGKGIEASHPYYWSGFVHVGATAALFNNGIDWKWWALGISLLLGLGLWWWRRTKN